MSDARSSTMAGMWTDRPFREMLAVLTGCRATLLIGVRHHSAAMARAVPALLDAFAPETVLVELPSDLSDWVRYLADPATVPPVAISAVCDDSGLFFYPLADFSPELVAIRWAYRNNVPVVACDLAVSAKSAVAEHGELCDHPEAVRDEKCQIGSSESMTGALRELLRRTGSANTGQLWERLVETPAVAQDAEAVRRAGLLFGWAVRSAERQHDSYNLLREAAMRRAIRKAPSRSAAVIGSFHASSLLPNMLVQQRTNDDRLLATASSADPPAISLVPYAFWQLDERSGYPAGIRDPLWHQKVSESQGPADIDRMSGMLVTDICRQLRAEGHVAGTPDATEILRMMRDLARMRGLPVAGRGELIEAIQSCLVQGELYGRGRAVAQAVETVLVGDQRGRVAPSVPKCGLAVHLDELLASLNLPGPETEGNDPHEVRLDVLRKSRDRARVVVLHRMSVARIPYATRVDSQEQGLRENVTQQWAIGWQHATAAMITSAAMHGVTLEQVAESFVRGRLLDCEGSADEVSPDVIVWRLQVAAECGLHNLVDQTLKELNRSFLQAASISQLVAAADCIGRIVAGHVPGLPRDESLTYRPIIRLYRLPESTLPIGPLLAACLDRLEGLEGSDRRQDVSGLVDLVYWFTGDLFSSVVAGNADQAGEVDVSEVRLGMKRLESWCRSTIRRGSDRMRGAAIGILGLLDACSAEQFTTVSGGWFDSATDGDGRHRLRYGLAGAVQVLLPLIQNEASWLDGLENRFMRSSDALFLARLPALRGGFNELSPADRRRTLDLRLAEYKERGTQLATPGKKADVGGLEAEDPALQLAARRAADMAGRAAVEQQMPDLLCNLSDAQQPDHDDSLPKSAEQLESSTLPPGSISLADRWRLVLAVTEARSSKACMAAACLDQLYGFGKGEGAGSRLAGRRPVRPRGGTESPDPKTIDWAEDLEDLFGSDVC